MNSILFPSTIQETPGHKHITFRKKSGSYIFGMEKTSLLNKILFENQPYSKILLDLEEFTGKGTTTCKKVIKDWILDGSIIKIGDLYKKK
jgi:hypothetical protein